MVRVFKILALLVGSVAYGEPFRVVLVMGQSNAEGGGTWGELSSEKQASVSIDYIRSYEDGLGRLLAHSAVQPWTAEVKFGPELGLSSVFKDNDSGLVILKYAVGATSIEEH